MADHDSKLVEQFYDLLQKLKHAGPEATNADPLIKKMNGVLIALPNEITGNAIAKGGIGTTYVNFASCFLESLTTLTTASSKLVGPILDLAEVMVKNKIIKGKSLSQLSDAISQVATSTAWGETVELKYVATCISLLRASVPNWKYGSQDPQVEKRVAVIMRCLWHWTDQTQPGEKIILPDSCADVCVDLIHKSISWLRDKSKDASAEDPISWTTELLGGAVCALKVPKDETVMDAAILISYAIMSGFNITTFSQSKAPEVLLHKLVDAVEFGSAAPKGLSVIKAVVNAVYLGCMKGFPFQREKLKEVAMALHTCIVNVDLQDPWLLAMSASLVTWWRTQFLYTDDEQSFLETSGQYAVEEFKKCTNSKLPLLQFLGLRLFYCHVERAGTVFQKPIGVVATDADALETYTPTLTDVIKRISLCVRSLSEVGPDRTMQLPDVPPIFKGTGWSPAKSVSISKTDDVTNLGPAWHFLWKCRTGITMVDDSPHGFKEKSSVLCILAVNQLLFSIVPNEHVSYAAFKPYEQIVAGSLSKIITTYGHVIYGTRDLKGCHDGSDSLQLNPKVITDGLSLWSRLLDKHLERFIQKDGYLRAIDASTAEFPFEFIGYGASERFLDEDVAKLAQSILEASGSWRVQDLSQALEAISLLSTTSMGTSLAYTPCAKRLGELEFMPVGDVSHLLGTEASCVQSVLFDDPNALSFALHDKAYTLTLFHLVRRSHGRTERVECQAYVKAVLEYVCNRFSSVISSEGIDPTVETILKPFIDNFLTLSDHMIIFLANSPKRAPLASLDNSSLESTDHGSGDRGPQDFASSDRARDHPLSDPSLRSSSDMGRRLELPESTTLQRSELVTVFEAILEIEAILGNRQATTSYQTSLDEARPELLNAFSKVAGSILTSFNRSGSDTAEPTSLSHEEIMKQLKAYLFSFETRSISEEQPGDSHKASIAEDREASIPKPLTA